MRFRASGLGRACVEDICRKGGYVAVLDMNEELATELVKEIGGGKTKFFVCNVLETESVAAAVTGTVEWAMETGKVVGGVIAAAGVSTPAKVSPPKPCSFMQSVLFARNTKQVLPFKLEACHFGSTRDQV